jgi:hypothetical protein
MNQGTVEPPKAIPGERTFKYVQKNWSDLEKPERVGLSFLIVLLAKKNRVEDSIKDALIGLLKNIRS